MAVASAERTDLSCPMDASPSRSSSDLASDSSSLASLPSAPADTPDRTAQSMASSPSPGREADPLCASSLRSEEYRQLFRLPQDEVLVQDFNCAIQESILIQGHLYVFLHHICFYSNIFGYETKKIIPFHEITSVKRAKTAGIFSNAIEIFAAEKKYFFGSFLSRDEAFKLIEDGISQHGNGTREIMEQQESISGSNGQENQVSIEKVDGFKQGSIEKVGSFKQGNGLDTNEWPNDAASSNDSKPATTNVDNDDVIVMQSQDNVESGTKPVRNDDTSSSSGSWTWNMETSDAPEIPKSFTRVAESKFPIKVEEFFNFFFSDDTIPFIESFHKKCGDKEFRCSSWKPHDKLGHARNVSFQHPIKIYFGAKFGSCQELQKFRIYRNSHLVIETSQEISDVPFGDYFRVEGLWDVVGDGSNEGCILRVFVDVAFSKKTMFKGKIAQSTLEECREAYAIWTEMAHELLKLKNLEKQEEAPSSSIIQNNENTLETESNTGGAAERSLESRDIRRELDNPGSTVANEQFGKFLQENLRNAASLVSLFGEYVEKISSFFRSQSQASRILIIAFIVILLMQVSIVLLLNRTQTVQVVYPGNYYGVGGMGFGSGERSTETVAWLERRIHHLKDEMLMVEARLERLQSEYSFLKAELKNLDKFGKYE